MSAIEYYNTLSTPSGKEYKLYEMQNKEYVVLLKFLQAENFSGFFESLDKIIEYSIPDIKDLDIIDRMYVYIAFYYYNISPTMPIKHPKLGPVDLKLENVLNSIEKSYINEHKFFKLNDKIEADVHYARDFYFEEGKPVVNYATCIKRLKVNEWVNVSKQDSERVFDTISTDVGMKIEMHARNELSSKINVFDLPMMEPVYININSQELIYFVFNLFKENLQNYYTELYISVQYLKMDKQSFDSLTPAEAMIMLKIMADDKEKQNKEMKKGSGIAIPSALDEDPMF